MKITEEQYILMGKLYNGLSYSREYINKNFHEDLNEIEILSQKGLVKNGHNVHLTNIGSQIYLKEKKIRDIKENQLLLDHQLKLNELEKYEIEVKKYQIEVKKHHIDINKYRIDIITLIISITSLILSVITWLRK